MAYLYTLVLFLLYHLYISTFTSGSEVYIIKHVEIEFKKHVRCTYSRYQYYVLDDIKSIRKLEGKFSRTDKLFAYLNKGHWIHARNSTNCSFEAAREILSHKVPSYSWRNFKRKAGVHEYIQAWAVTPTSVTKSKMKIGDYSSEIHPILINCGRGCDIDRTRPNELISVVCFDSINSIRALTEKEIQRGLLKKINW